MKKAKKPSFAASDAATAGDEKKELPKNLKKKLEECEKVKNEYLAGWQRERADFLNYKKGELERVGELIKYADTGLILKFLSILDSFELASKKISEELKNNEDVKGLLQIKSQIKDVLKSRGVEEIESLGKKFDPNTQEVVEVVDPSSARATAGDPSSAASDAATAGEAGIVIEELQKGYKIHGKILRPAKVKVIK
jgi:molecular chaperone GrpE